MGLMPYEIVGWVARYQFKEKKLNSIDCAYIAAADHEFQAVLLSICFGCSKELSQ